MICNLNNNLKEQYTIKICEKLPTEQSIDFQGSTAPSFTASTSNT